MIKTTILFLIIIVAACSPKHDQKVQSTQGESSRGEASKLDAEGGVDVGNLQSTSVPLTKASLSYPKTWTPSLNKNILVLSNRSGSLINARKAEIKDLASPNATALLQYFKRKHPDRHYQKINFNGLEGVRAELIETATRKKSDLYLVSEFKDFLHIESDLQNTDEGLSQGDQIISSVRVKYQGVPYENPQVKTVILKARAADAKGDHYAYSFLGDCYTYTKGCNPSGGVGSAYQGKFRIGLAGYQHGRIIELGPTSEIPFDSIRIEGEYLVGPKSKTPISDIYTAFIPKNPQAEQDEIQLQEGHLYLVRTINWPEEDLITKMSVEKVNQGVSVTMTYQKLIYVPEDELQKQVDLINEYTRENEAPLSEGAVMLYNRSYWNNYFFASFNFEYSTSGNMFITNNAWDLIFENDCSGRPSFSVPHTSAGLGEVVDLGVRDLSSITTSDFPDPKNYQRNCGTEIVNGHTYAVYHYHLSKSNDGPILGAVQVLDLDSDNKWVLLKFKRIKAGYADIPRHR